MKIKVDKLDIEKLETTPVDLTKLSNVGENDTAKKTKYDWLKMLTLLRLLILAT